MDTPDWIKQPIPEIFDASNNWFVSEEISNSRFKTCKECPHFNNVTKTCKICGCFMPIKVKVRIMKCPDNPSRWE